MEMENLITKRNVGLSVVALIVLVFIGNILMAYIILPANYYQNLPPGAENCSGAWCPPPLPPPPPLSELFLYSITNPLVLILAMGGGLWLILSGIGKKETAIPDKSSLQKDSPVMVIYKKEPVMPDRYRIYLTFILTLIALLSIQLLSMKVIKTPPPYPNPTCGYNSIIPPIIIVSVVTIFVAITTYLRRYYPYAAIFASLLLGVFYLPALQYIPNVPNSFGFSTSGIYFLSIPVFVIASALWRGEKMGVVYPVAYSLVLGILVGGVLIPNAGVEILFITGLSYILIFISGIVTVISFLTKSRYELTTKYFIPSLKVTLSLIVFLIMTFVTYYIFQPFYIQHCGWSD